MYQGLGGDEFNILLPNTNREDALELAEKVMEAFKNPLLLDQYELFVTACIGISMFPYDGEDSLVLVKNADAALYRAKEQGKNSYKVFHSGMNIQSYRNFVLQNDLRKAVEKNELSIVYQPRIDIESGKVTSAEALLRWNHPSWGLIQPSEFIPIAEETGQVVELGNWVLQEVCRQNKAWQNAGLTPIRIAINFSSQQFLQKDLIETISQTLKETGISSDMLEIEITESAIFKNERIMRQILNSLKNSGVYLSMDDFGMGYSSLNYLRQFPVDAIKIDRSFIQDLSHKTQESKAIVSAIVALAHGLKMSVIAEGIETEDQLNSLRELKCEEFQGYLFSPPVLPKEFEVFLLKSNPKEPSITIDDLGSSVFKLQDTRALLMDEESFNKKHAIVESALNHMKELYSISTRELDVFKLIVNGLSNKEISDRLFISEHTVKNHITRIFQKLTVNDRLQAMAKVYQTCIEEGKNLRTQPLN